MLYEPNVKNWYVIYTLPNTEKKVHASLGLMNIESFLPVQTVFRKWSDRVKTLVVPLFPSYLFVSISATERFSLSKINGFLRYVSFNGKPSVVSDKEIDALRRIMTGDVEVDNNYLPDKAGSPILITSGPFAGIEGTLIRKNNGSRVLVKIPALQKSVSVSVPADSVAPLHA